MTCKDVIGLLLDFLEDALTPEALEAFNEHFRLCRPCVAYLNTYKRTRDLTGQVARVPMPEEMKTRLRELLARQFSQGAS